MKALIFYLACCGDWSCSTEARGLPNSQFCDTEFNGSATRSMFEIERI